MLTLIVNYFSYTSLAFAAMTESMYCTAVWIRGMNIYQVNRYTQTEEVYMVFWMLWWPLRSQVLTLYNTRIWQCLYFKTQCWHCIFLHFYYFHELYDNIWWLRADNTASTRVSSVRVVLSYTCSTIGLHMIFLVLQLHVPSQDDLGHQVINVKSC